MTQEELQELCEEWQERLSLRDWRVTAEFTDTGGIAGKAVGNNRWTLALKAANIYILEERYIPDNSIARDIEETLVHELLHLHFAKWSDETYLKDDEYGMPVEGEQGVDAISRALVALKRAAEKANAPFCGDMPLAEVTD
jgi:predicted SprT family Zn-dependent metalloprotease